ncbi:hypothetical protein MVES1_001668 [Malassezia vespertilionis]|uniref:50S ribosomal protein L35 n=1 Tax=Malassezia vespertilionis TaxID=2020962 RepID=A0A2N1JDP0_9BASI|nr:uncharacterized protein MVES1_001668 [Malassezia vespertilionis]PKI84654.1 hypothetical protein MVES_001570 [Malassezia vespertilionis]WFD06323.1 hypothetical protein MVES1_001668 [Malassezia vespertilionis]
MPFFGALTRGALFRAPLRTFSSSAALGVAPRPAKVNTKLKTHSGAKKRFFPMTGTGKGAAPLTKFKHGHANKQHLNSAMSRVRLNRLEKSAVVSGGRTARMLRRLLAPRM